MDKPDAKPPELPPLDASNDDIVYQHFMASPCVTWRAFANSVGFNVASSYARYPTSAWTQEKRLGLRRENAESLQEILDKAIPELNLARLAALKKTPVGCATGIELVQIAMATLHVELADHARAVRTAQMAQMQAPRPPKGLMADLMSASMAYSMFVNAQQKALLLNDLTVKTVIEKTDTDVNIQAGGEKQAANPLTFEILGMPKMSPEKMVDIYRQYFDAPQQKIEADPESLPPDGTPAEQATAESIEPEVT